MESAKRQRVRGVVEFLDGFHSKPEQGAVVFMADNTFEQGRGGELIGEEGVDDTFKMRTLSDGSQYKVLKSYYNYNELHQILASRSKNLKINTGSWCWWVNYQVT